jgi:S1-C subfamily serine protease
MMNTKKIRLLWIVIMVTLPILACGISIPSASVIPTLSRPMLTPISQVSVQAPLTTVISDEDAVIIDLYKRVNPAVVSIVDYVQQGDIVQAMGQGSGFVYDQEGHIITNAHVVQGADEVEVKFPDGTILKAKIIGEDLHSDLAVVKVDHLPGWITPLNLGNLDSVAVGQTVVAIGNPFGLGGTLTKGIVSALGRTIPALTPFSIPQSIQTDAPINPGNSGGPLLNLAGEVIGVNAQIETGGQTNANSGVGFAIPVSIVRRVVPDLIQKGEHVWAWLGVRGGSVLPDLVSAMNLPVEKGAYIANIEPGGPADKAGLRGATRNTTINGREISTGGDVIIAIDGQPVNSFEDILIYIALSTDPGQKVTLTIIRDGQQKEVLVTLEPRPASLDQSQVP